MDPYMEKATNVVNDMNSQYILGLAESSIEHGRWISMVAQLASYPDVLENYLMMRAEPWRKQELYAGDPIMEAASPKSYSPIANFNWTEERQRVVDIVGVDSFSKYAAIQKELDWFEMRVAYKEKTGYSISDGVEKQI